MGDDFKALGVSAAASSLSAMMRPSSSFVRLSLFLHASMASKSGISA